MRHNKEAKMFKTANKPQQTQSKQKQQQQPPSVQPPPAPLQLTPSSSSSPYTITSSLSSSSCSLPPPVPSLLTQPKKSSLSSLKSVVSAKSNHSVKSTCNTQKCFISIWSTWYCIVIVALHIYLLKNRIADLVNLFSLNSDLFSWSSLTFNTPLNATITLEQLNSSVYFEIITRLCMVILSILFLLLFLVSSLKPLGNYSNDGIKFGRDFFYEKIKHSHLLNKKKSNKSSSCFKDLIEIIWRHFLPINSFCHLISILLLIFPRVIYDDSSRTVVNYAVIKSCLSNTTSANPCLLNFYLTQVNQASIPTFKQDEWNIIYLVQQISDYKIELISLCLAFVSLYIRYGSVFWFTNKCLSFLITFIGFIASIEQLLQLYSFIYIYNQLNLSELNYWTTFYSKSNVTIEVATNQTESSLPLQADTLLAWFEIIYLIRNKFSLLFLYFTLSLLVYLSATPAYVFAFLKYKERFIIEEALFIRQMASKSGNKHKEDDFSSSSASSIQNEHAKLPIYDKKVHIRSADIQVYSSTCCFNYCPHLIATIQLVLICASKLPFCYDYVIYFNKSKDSGIFLVILVEILHTIILIFIWLLLTLKTEWNMHLQTAFTICHWTYHMKRKQSEDAKHSNFTKIKTITGSEMMPSDTKKLIESGNSNQTDFMDYNNKKGNYPKTSNNYDQNTVSKPATLLTYQEFKPSNTIVVRNNNNNNNNSNNPYGNCNYPRQLLEAKHKSMIDKYEENNIYSTNNELSRPQLLPAGSDYLLNSETLYRNEIRKSIRNIMQQKRCSNSALIGSSATLVAASSMAHLMNQQKLNNENTKDPYYYQHQNENAKKKLVGGVYLSSTTPTVIDNSSIKIPAVAHVVTSTMCSSNSSTTASIPRHPEQCNTPNTNKNRAVLYLERRPSSSNEYESRV